MDRSMNTRQIASRLRSIESSKKEFTFQVTTSDGGSHGKAEFTVEARTQALAWTVFLREHKGILPYLVELRLLK